METVTVQSLPAEVLEHVFSQLEPSNLKTAVLVCKRWKDIGEAPKLWTWVYHWVNRGNLANMPRILASKRLRALKAIAVRSFSEELLMAIIKHPSIQELDLTDADWSLSTIEPELLVSLTLKMKEMTVDMNTLSDMQTTFLSKALESIPQITGFPLDESCSGDQKFDKFYTTVRISYTK